eukprot:gnl/Ergobibamus_cyprinoides/1761.p2 GENE.gnl/Ergobibamus_cyprinoides/1761~~gnl/Ergobibamus_cyprinoides/1761.p2  ORF type:complete len:148 (+),score=11.94 gnl/Ergobibamus_cyprinoides/1761:693-1136(+)
MATQPHIRVVEFTRLLSCIRRAAGDASRRLAGNEAYARLHGALSKLASTAAGNGYDFSRSSVDEESALQAALAMCPTVAVDVGVPAHWHSRGVRPHRRRFAAVGARAWRAAPHRAPGAPRGFLGDRAPRVPAARGKRSGTSQAPAPG